MKKITNTLNTFPVIFKKELLKRRKIAFSVMRTYLKNYVNLKYLVMRTKFLRLIVSMKEKIKINQMNREKRKIKFKKKCCKREKIKIKRINKAELNKKISKYKKNVLTNIVIKMIKLHLMKIEISP